MTVKKHLQQFRVLEKGNGQLVYDLADAGMLSFRTGQLRSLTTHHKFLSAFLLLLHVYINSWQKYDSNISQWSVSAIPFEYLISCIKIGVDSRLLNIRWVAQPGNTFFCSIRLVFSLSLSSTSLSLFLIFIREYTRFEQCYHESHVFAESFQPIVGKIKYIE